jgi:transcription antitermination factor NusG
MEKKEETRWCIVYTRPNAEKRICSELSKMSIKTYLPIQKVSKSNRELEMPLFPNYLFVNVNKAQTWAVLNVVGVVKYLEGDNKRPIEVPEKEIEQVKSNELVLCQLFENNKKVQPNNLIKLEVNKSSNNNLEEHSNGRIVSLQSSKNEWKVKYQEA